MVDCAKRVGVLTLLVLACCEVRAAPPAACRKAVFEGELNAGQAVSQPIGNGLRVYFQPIAAGWILRILPVAGARIDHDYAELATPPYQSVTPLSISTDFAFRAQDAVGWNPRRFRFATTEASFARLQRDYAAVTAKPGPTPEAEAGLARDLAQTAEGTLKIMDARLVPGTADQWKMAAAVASHFLTTAHTLVEEPDGHTSPLGRLVWLRFRLELDVAAGFRADPGLRLEPAVCQQGQ